MTIKLVALVLLCLITGRLFLWLALQEESKALG
jgi:hypothetical protein